MAIAPIGAAFVPPTLTGLGLASPAAPSAPKAPGTQGVSQSGFGNMLADSVQKIQNQQVNADSMASQVATGQITDVHDYTIAATEANLSTELALAIRNKAVEGFNDIMRMPI